MRIVFINQFINSESPRFMVLKRFWLLLLYLCSFFPWTFLGVCLFTSQVSASFLISALDLCSLCTLSTHIPTVSLTQLPLLKENFKKNVLRWNWTFCLLEKGFPGASVLKNLLPNRRCNFDTRVRKIPWSRKWPPIPPFLPRKSHRQRSLAGYSPWGLNESDTTKRLNNIDLHEKGGTVLQCVWHCA